MGGALVTSRPRTETDQSPAELSAGVKLAIVVGVSPTNPLTVYVLPDASTVSVDVVSAIVQTPVNSLVPVPPTDCATIPLPVGPMVPVGPVAPVGPVRPVNPVAPVGPVLPPPPVGPVRPVDPV